MVIFAVWIITFALILYVGYHRWESSLSPALDKILPEMLKPYGDNRTLWVGVLAVLGATTMVKPVDILMVVLLITIIVLVALKVASIANRKMH